MTFEHHMAQRRLLDDAKAGALPGASSQRQRAAASTHTSQDHNNGRDEP